MSRPWRIEYPGALYHVMSRGNERKAIFRNNDDRRMLLTLLGETAERFDLEVYAYVLMTNHYHILLKTNGSNLSKSMQWFGATYTRRYNICHKRTGHLFQGRFKSFLIQDDSYLLRLSCYIHRNPLRAGMVKRLSDYKWSSYPVYAYNKEPEDWANYQFILNMFQGDKRQKAEAYHKMVRQYSSEEKKTLEDLKCGLVFGSLSYLNEIRSKFLPKEINPEKSEQRYLMKTLDIHDLIDQAAEFFNFDWKQTKNQARLRGQDKILRDMLILLLWEQGAFKNEEIGNAMGISYSGVSKSVSAIKKQIQKDNRLKKKYKSFYSQFKM